MARALKTVVPAQSRTTSFWTALVLMASLITTFAIVTLFMTYHHGWTDEITAALPMPGPITSLAADPALPDQLRLEVRRAWYTTLADQTSTLVAEATVVNDSLLSVSNVVIEARAYREGEPVRTTRTVCGRSISNRLLRRLPRDELLTLQQLRPPVPAELIPGNEMECQVAFAGLEPGAEEVSIRIASVEPFPGHSRPLFHPEG